MAETCLLAFRDSQATITAGWLSRIRLALEGKPLADGFYAGSEQGTLASLGTLCGAPSWLRSPLPVFRTARKPSPHD